MSLMLYFLRHGQTILSREDVFCGSGSDPELTEDGLAMAQLSLLPIAQNPGKLSTQAPCGEQSPPHSLSVMLW